MISNYIKSFIRFLGKHKAYSINNILGLSIGMAAAILIYLWILDELSFDQFHENYEDIYRIWTTMYDADGEFNITATAAPLAPAFEEAFPELLESARFRPAISEMLVSYGEKKFYEDEIAFADKEFFRIFTHPFIHGSSDDPFPTVNSAVITQQIAEKYFGNENPVGKTIRLDENTIVTISGVIENVPANSHLHFNILGNFELLRQLGWNMGWENLSMNAYVLLSDGTDYPSLKSQIDTLTKQLYSHGTYEFHLQSLSDVHLRSSFDMDVYSHSEPRYQYVRIFILIGILIILISGINYINLSTARSTMRALEVGIRKVYGASKAQLIRQFMGESFILCLLSYLIAMLLVEIALPQFNQFTGKEVNINYSNPGFSIGVLVILIFMGIFSGAYPSLYLASYIPMNIIQGNVKAGPAAFRKILVFVQFSIATLMIICSIVVYRQLAFIQNHNLGINTDQIIYCGVKGNIGDSYQSFREELLKHPGIKGVANSSSLPTWSGMGTYDINWEGKERGNKLHIIINQVDHNFIPTFSIEMAEGRNFSINRPGDSSNYILNETAIRLMKIEDPIGKRCSMWGTEGQIIGVMKDFNFKSLHKEIEPLLFFISVPQINKMFGYIFFKLEGRNIRNTIKVIESTWKEVNPSFPLDYKFLDEEYEKLYITESRMRSLFTIFAALAVFLSCLGLYGLSSFMAENRTREIGIRKALGARLWQIITLFSLDALKWILISNLIAWPIAWYYTKQWLNNFAYKTDINLWIFILTGFIILLIAIITLSFQAQKAARINPATTIKYE